MYTIRLGQVHLSVKSRAKNNGFVVDGRARLISVVENEIRRAVESEFAAQWAAAGWFHRWRLRRKINAEIARRLEQAAPRDALY